MPVPEKRKLALARAPSHGGGVYRWAQVATSFIIKIHVPHEKCEVATARRRLHHPGTVRHARLRADERDNEETLHAST
jgi:hypothetical protein